MSSYAVCAVGSDMNNVSLEAQQEQCSLILLLVQGQTQRMKGLSHQLHSHTHTFDCHFHNLAEEYK